VKLIGLTGGIATGKTTVSRLLQESGVPVIDADAVYSKLSEKGNRVWEVIHQAFGEKFFLSDGEMDRKALGNLIFSDNQAREKLDRITHPIVKEEMLRILRRIKKEQNPSLIVMDVPLLFESGWNRWMDEVWVVAVPEEMQIERLVKRDNLSREEALLRIKSQMSIEEKKKLAHRVIDNSRSVSDTKSQVEKILDEYGIRGN
jgi:dephospho-CoA kinase